MSPFWHEKAMAGNWITLGWTRSPSALPSVAKGRSVQFGESPGVVAQSLGSAGAGRGDGPPGPSTGGRLESATAVRMAPKHDGRKLQLDYATATQENPPHMKFVFASRTRDGGHPSIAQEIKDKFNVKLAPMRRRISRRTSASAAKSRCTVDSLAAMPPGGAFCVQS